MTLAVLNHPARRFAPFARKDRAPASRSRRMRTHARAALSCFAVAVLTLNAAAMLLLDEIHPGIRDPEYGRRVARYKVRVAENPGRPMVLVIGSSRAAMGVCPAAWEENRPAVPGRADPLLFNLSLIGSGPVQELMIVRRAFADGLRPAVVLFEYWPPFLYAEGDWFEPKRVHVDRLSPIDRQVVRDYFPDPAAVEARMWPHRWNPLFASRHRLFVQLFPKWLSSDKRIDRVWNDVDDWGWKPGFDLPAGPSEPRAAMLEMCRDTYKPLFADYRVAPAADRAIREAVAAARERGAAVGFVYLPESSQFRGWYSPEAERSAREHLAGLSRDLAMPVIDARMWMADELFADGFHLTRIGAAEFTRKLGPEVATTFPEARP